ncbi:MAG: DUF885 domain-containing protein [bacterium]|nr:DUF885 domain-containing protein [bacterium]
MRTSVRISIATVLIAASFSATACGPRRYVPDRARDDSRRLAAFLEEVFAGRLDRDPLLATRLERGHGRRSAREPSRWPDPSDTFRAESQEMLEHARGRLVAEFSVSSLDDRAVRAYRFFEWQSSENVKDFEWRFHESPVRPGVGGHVLIEELLVDLHDVADEVDAENYVLRLERVERYTQALAEALEERRARGILMPRFAYDEVIDEAHRFVARAPDLFVDDLDRKMAALGRPARLRREEFLRRAREAVELVLTPAVESLIEVLESHRSETSGDVGVWHLPDGDRFYVHALRRMTTLELTPDEVYRLGLREVRLAQSALTTLVLESGTGESLAELLDRLRSEPLLGGPDDLTGDATLRAEIERYASQIRAQLVELVTPPPQWQVDLSRDPLRASTMPLSRVPVHVHGELAPGRQLRDAVVRAREQLVPLMQWSTTPSHQEGWAQYAEQLPRSIELGTDVGCATARLWHAALVVVDAGVHANRWSRERANEYLFATTARGAEECAAAVDRVILAPAHAAAGLVGRLRLERLRERGAERLKRDFDTRSYHDVVLHSGPLPLDLLEEAVDAWIEEQE